MINKQEPLEVKAYQCPYNEIGCNFLSLDQKQAERHSNIPINEPLPAGLVYVARRIEVEDRHYRKVNNYEVVLDKGRFESGDGGTNLEHSYTQPIACFSYLGKHIDEGVVNSGIFKQVLAKGSESYDEDFGLLTEKEFERVSKFFPYCLPQGYYSLGTRKTDLFDKIIRTTPELDELLSQRKAKPLRIRKQFPLEEFIGTNGHKKIFRTTIETCGVRTIDPHCHSILEITIKGSRGEDGYPDKIVLEPEQTQEFLRGRHNINFSDMPVIAFYEGKVFSGIIFDEERIKRMRRKK